jgi:hypothetical protein
MDSALISLFIIDLERRKADRMERECLKDGQKQIQLEVLE